MDIQHPLIRSVLLPFALALVLGGLLRAALGAQVGARWAAAGLAVALVVAAFNVVGWQARAGTLTEKLPWVIAAAALLGLVLEAVASAARVRWMAATALWALALLALGVASPLAGLLAWVAGAAVIAAVLQVRSDGADAPALLAVAGLGLAGVAMLSASLLLFELALGGAVAAVGLALWLWPRARIAFGASGRIVAVLAWLALAYATLRLTQAPVAALVLLALVFAVGPLLDRRHPAAGAPARAWTRPLWRALGGAVLAAGALALTLWGPGAPSTGPAEDSPYYTPRW